MSEDYFPGDYRQARRAFIAAAEAACVDVIARVHPDAAAADGKPLFLDSAAFGARDARKALLLISGARGADGFFGSGVQTGLMRTGLIPSRRTQADGAAPDAARIVLLHALDPEGFAANRRTGAHRAEDWPLKMLRAMAAEDLRQVRHLHVLNFQDRPGSNADLKQALRRQLQGVTLVFSPVEADAALPDAKRFSNAMTAVDAALKRL